MELQDLRKILREWIEVDETSSLDEAAEEALTNPLVVWSAIINGSALLGDENASVLNLLERLQSLRQVIEEGFNCQPEQAQFWKDFSIGLIESDEDNPDLHHLETLLNNPACTEEQRQKSAEFFANHIWKGRYYSSNPKARLGIKRLREQFVYMETLAATCVLLAISHSAERTKIRIGSHWLTTATDGKTITRIMPLALIRKEYQAWLAQRSRTYFEKRAMEEYSEARSEEELRHLIDQKPKSARRRKRRTSSGHQIARNYVEDRLIEALDRKPEPPDLLSILDNAKPPLSPQLQEYLEHKTIAFNEDQSITETQARALVCKIMGITPEHGRQIEFQIRKKLSQFH